jgi:alpha-1,6-mannosyltransferase
VTVNIVDVSMFYAPQSGGVKRYLLAKHAWLSAEPGVRHSLLVPGPGEPAAGAINELPSLPIPFANGYRLPWRLGDWHRTLEQLGPDVIEAGDPYQLAWTALAAAGQLSIPVVGFYHSDLPRLVGKRFGPVARALAERYVVRLYRRFDLVLAPSRCIAARLRKMGIATVRHQPLGVDSACFHPGARDPKLKDELGVDPDTRMLIYVGRFAREKNIPLLINTAKVLGRGYHLLLVGSGARIPAQDNVTVLPYERDTAVLARLLASADALVHAGTEETFGLVAIEAMACGLPVVTVAGSPVQELIDSNSGMVAPRASAEHMAAAVRNLFARNLSAMSQAARARVQDSYSWDQAFSRLLGHYAGLPQLAYRGLGDSLRVANAVG